MNLGLLVLGFSALLAIPGIYLEGERRRKMEQKLKELENRLDKLHSHEAEFLTPSLAAGITTRANVLVARFLSDLLIEVRNACCDANVRHSIDKTDAKAYNDAFDDAFDERIVRAYRLMKTEEAKGKHGKVKKKPELKSGMRVDGTPYVEPKRAKKKSKKKATRKRR